jgi:hypothetical protein
MAVFYWRKFDAIAKEGGKREQELEFEKEMTQQRWGMQEK